MESSTIVALYEQLRGYMMSEYKTISVPLGLDLWLKQGFKGWLKILTSYKKNYKEKLENTSKNNCNVNLSNPDLELAILITNLVLNRS